MPQLSFSDLLGAGSGILSTLRPEVKNIVRQNTLDLEAHALNLGRDRHDVVPEPLVTPVKESQPTSFSTPITDTKPQSLVTPATEQTPQTISTPNNGPVEPLPLHHIQNWMDKAKKAGFITAGKDENPDGLGIILPDGSEVLAPGYGEDSHGFIMEKLGIAKPTKGLLGDDGESEFKRYDDQVRKAYAKGIIHKSGPNMFLIDPSAKSTLPVLENKLTNTQLPVGEKIYIDTTKGKSYAFPHFEFARNGFKLDKMLTKKYEVKQGE